MKSVLLSLVVVAIGVIGTLVGHYAEAWGAGFGVSILVGLIVGGASADLT